MGTTSEFLGQVPRLTDGKRGGVAQDYLYWCLWLRAG